MQFDSFPKCRTTHDIMQQRKISNFGYSEHENLYFTKTKGYWSSKPFHEVLGSEYFLISISKPIEIKFLFEW